MHLYQMNDQDHQNELYQERLVTNKWVKSGEVAIAEARWAEEAARVSVPVEKNELWLGALPEMPADQLLLVRLHSVAKLPVWNIHEQADIHKKKPLTRENQG